MVELVAKIILTTVAVLFNFLIFVVFLHSEIKSKGTQKEKESRVGFRFIQITLALNTALVLWGFMP